MSSENENPVERLEEHIHETAEHDGETWLKWAALMTAVIAVLAAGAGLVSSDRADTGMLEQIRASDQWGYYQAKGIKSIVLESERDMLTVTQQKIPQELDEHIKRYQDEQTEIKKSADELTEASHRHLEQHDIFARAVTLFQVAIAMTAVAMLARKRRFLAISAVFVGLALYYMAEGFWL